MPEDNDDDLDGPDDQMAQIPLKDLRNLRSIAKTHTDVSSRLSATERELAFAKAKLDLDDPKMGYFIKGYEGELDPVKIREAAEAAGFVSSQQQQIPPQELGAHQQMGSAAAGGTEGGTVDLGQAIKDARSPEEVMQLMTAAGRATTWNRPE